MDIEQTHACDSLYSKQMNQMSYHVHLHFVNLWHPPCGKKRKLENYKSVLNMLTFFKYVCTFNLTNKLIINFVILVPSIKWCHVPNFRLHIRLTGHVLDFIFVSSNSTVFIIS